MNIQGMKNLETRTPYLSRGSANPYLKFLGESGLPGKRKLLREAATGFWFDFVSRAKNVSVGTTKVFCFIISPIFIILVNSLSKYIKISIFN